MKPEQKIEKIRAKCQEILELGKLRTQGRWRIAHGGLGNKDKLDTVYATNDDLNYIAACRDYLCFYEPPRNTENASFIASCAGTAEAMARSTLSLLDAVVIYGNSITSFQLITDSILKAWPDELL